MILPKVFSRQENSFSEEEKRVVFDAYILAKAKHKGQKRRSGCAYIMHPLRVAARLANDGYDYQAIAAALLHDVLENTDATYDELKTAFGQEIANLVEGVTKISALRTKGKGLAHSDETMYLRQADNYRKILLAASSDIRVIIIKLYDRLDNAASLEFIPEQKRRFYARETIEIYAQIAERLGMGIVKGELEDSAFPFAYPDEYAQFIKIAKPAYKNPKRVIDESIPAISSALTKAGIKYTNIAGRAKHLYSLYNKVKQGKNIANIFDIIALRIIVHSVEDCYRVLGLVHGVFPPIPGQIDDYIARPKNGIYQSLHTKVSNGNGDVFEIQIRTEEMHEINEYGPAAHWSYKDSYVEKNAKIAERNRQEWLAELKKIHDIHNKRELIREIKEELFSKQVFVFTPKGEIVKLPTGSCGLDFAYRIHTALGNTCSGIKINDRLMPISTALKTGDVVEILTSKKASPSSHWLKFVKTSNAKHHIRNAIRAKNYDFMLETGERLIAELIGKHRFQPLDKAKANQFVANSVLPYNDLGSAYVAIAEGVLQKLKLLKVLYPELNTSEKKLARRQQVSTGIASLANIKHVMAGCCKPTPQQDNVVGYLTKEHIIKIHKKQCKRIISVDPRRLIEI